MKARYYPETDSLYINLSDQAGVDSQEVASGIVFDFDAKGRLVGLDIQQASERIDLSQIEREVVVAREEP